MTILSTQKRASGILAHISSLPSPYGIGDIGTSACRFIDFLKESGQKYWQILPTGPTSLIFDSSPYMSTSAFAGSPLLISPELLAEKELLKRSELETSNKFNPFLTNFQQVTAYKQKLLNLAFTRFQPSSGQSYTLFCRQTDWLDDYALFMTLKNVFQGKPWYQWPRDLAGRSPSSLQAARKQYEQQYNYYAFEQFLFYSQWSILKNYAADNQIRIIGDIPIYISLDSADVWSHQELFEINQRTLKPLRVSGVPPDYFSKTGQRWGNPLYRWNSKSADIREGLLKWWSNRFKAVFELVDVARIDHFRGFESYWAIPESEDTAVKGTWVKGPGSLFFKKVHERLGQLDIIAEDLGEITDDVHKLRDRSGFPGMKVLQFAFDGNPGNPFLPYNFSTPNCVVYTGTHDNDTTLGWFMSENLDDELRRTIKKMANRDLHDYSSIHEDLIYLALSSTANLAIIPLQDILGFGGDCRMNTPGIPTGNWKWRCAPEFLSDERTNWLKEITTRFGR